MGCAFGKLNDYKYWFVDASIPVTIPLGLVNITKITGGASNHMVGTKSAQQLIQEIVSGQANANGSSQTYIPDENAGLSFRAGVGVMYAAKEEAFNGDVLFTINFNSNGGLSNISLIGDAYMMVKRSDRQNASNYARGNISIAYDNVEKILDAQLNVNAQFSGAINGQLWSQIYISPNLWFIKLGEPANPAYINVLNLAYANAYLMMGQQLPPMPPPPAQVSQILNSSVLNQRNESAIVLGNGIAAGMNFNISFDESIGFGGDDNRKYSIYAIGSAGAGFDMTLYNYGPNAHCSGSNEPIGLKGWYLQGQLYAYFSMSMGITGRLAGNDFDISLINGGAALLLQGKLPKPTFVQGDIALNATVLGVIHVNVNFDFEFGNNCSIVQG